MESNEAKKKKNRGKKSAVLPLPRAGFQSALKAA